MNILSLYWGICSSVSLVKNNEVVAAAHEERFARVKNDDSFPQEAIKYCLKEAGMSPYELDGVAVASYVQPCDDTLMHKCKWSIDDYLEEQYKRWKPYLIDKTSSLKSVLEIFHDRIDLDCYPSHYWREVIKLTPGERQKAFEKDRNKIVSDFLGISAEKIRRIEHHRCHAVYSYYASEFRGEQVLAFTIDGWGDGLNATIGIFDQKGNYTRVFETDQCNIGRIYRYMTLLLGMKPNEHEYKVMGLAPYGKEKYARRALTTFKSTLYVDGIEFKWNIKPADSYFWFKERLEGVRFDNIAFALQTWVEDLLVEWIKNAVKKFGIHKIVISGGVAMNIKAMGKIAQLPEVEDMFIGGSGSDESMAISSGICLAEDITREQGKNWDSSQIVPLLHLYLGPKATLIEERALLEKLDRNKFEVVEKPTSRYMAELIANGKILARCADRMEFGQRALGNRSILADPVNLKVKEKINAAIKNRDFWMPFAPVIMDKYVNRYLINPKNLRSPHMTIGFDTTAEGYEAMIAACHPADKTARPQILYREANPSLYEILEEFEKITGRGALLNTSFNLHGYPIVNTPQEAMEVFENSGLEGLVLNNYLILKKG